MAKTAVAEGGCQHFKEGSPGRHRKVPVDSEDQLVHQFLLPGDQQIESGSGDQMIQALGLRFTHGSCLKLQRSMARISSARPSCSLDTMLRIHLMKSRHLPIDPGIEEALIEKPQGSADLQRHHHQLNPLDLSSRQAWQHQPNSTRFLPFVDDQIEGSVGTTTGAFSCWFSWRPLGNSKTIGHERFLSLHPHHSQL